MEWRRIDEGLPPNGSICVVYIDINAPLGDWFSKISDIEVDCNYGGRGHLVHPTYIKVSHIPIMVKIDNEKNNYVVTPRELLKKPYWCCEKLWVAFCDRKDIFEKILDQPIEFSITKDCMRWLLIEKSEGK